MRKRKIYTANEEFRGVAFTLLFTLVWYAGILRSIWQSGMHSTMMIFLVAGLLLPAQAVRTMRKALYYRRFAREVKSLGRPKKGKIVNIVREMQTEYTSRNTHRYYYYYLIVEVTDPETGLPSRIRSEAYRVPVYKYLASPYVDVYVDSSGWKYVLDGFELKKNRNEPDIPLEDANVYLKDFTGQSVFFKLIAIAVLVLMLFQILGILR